jgi:biotin carboxyl carrier protein
MKMESNVTAPMAGAVEQIHLPEGSTVEAEDLVISLNSA